MVAEGMKIRDRGSFGDKTSLPSVFVLTMYIQFSLMISLLVLNSRAMGSISANHGDGHTERPAPTVIFFR
jgi:hypothetical protein